MPKLLMDDTKLPYHKERLHRWLSGEKIVPITVEWALTPKCTYRCIFDNYCYTAKDRATKREFTEEAAFNFVDDAAEIGVKAIPLGSDGESTCVPFLYDVIPYAKSKGLDIALSTNGFLLKDDRLDDILPHLTYLRFNISAATPGRYSEIMVCPDHCYEKVIHTVQNSIKLKKDKQYDVTIGLQMVLMPQMGDQILPMAALGKELGVDYLVIKHCDENSIKSLGVDYKGYHSLIPELNKAETYSDDTYTVYIKWSKILSMGKRKYTRCFGTQFMMQISGTGDIGPCHASFHNRNPRVRIGNVIDTRFKELWNSDRYWEVMNHLSSDHFDHSFCTPLCFHYKTNEFLSELKNGKIDLEAYQTAVPPAHKNFI